MYVCVLVAAAAVGATCCGWVAFAGPHCQGLQLMDAIESNMRKEYTLEGVYQVSVCMCVRLCVPLPSCRHSPKPTLWRRREFSGSLAACCCRLI